MGKNILVVEDDVLVAMDLAEELLRHDFDVVGPFMNNDDALDALDDTPCHAAILDVNLSGGATSEAVAIALRARDIPFLVTSGYSASQYPDGFKDAPALSKPVQADQLIAMLDKALGID